MPTDDPNVPSSPPGDVEIATTFRRLRRDGHSRLEAMRMILDVLDVSLSEAKELLLTSETWAEAKAETDSDPDSPRSDVPPPAPG